KHDFRTTAVADGKEMRRVMERSHVDLLVLDLMLPGEDGLSLCRELRARSQVPIIMLTARGEDVDRIVGLELGADDYLGKPFNPRELLGRIKAILRRAARAPRACAASASAAGGWIPSPAPSPTAPGGTSPSAARSTGCWRCCSDRATACSAARSSPSCC